ncbi:hypothetical protein [Streptomyces sp. NPDC055105]|uniref:hypothetical protein n=1 Tax=Streptomyces sp. NPDC055105 TaxID=3365719 RepID=UPI0037D26DCB
MFEVADLGEELCDTGASAADFLFRTSELEAKDLGATMTAVDTAASWWRSQTA